MAKKLPPGHHTPEENKPGRTEKDIALWDAYVLSRATGQRTKQKILLGQLCVLHEPLAMRYLQRFMSKWSQFGALPLEDMQQAARVGLMRSIQSFDPGSGRFGSWCHLWVRLELGVCAESYGVRTKKLPVDAATYRDIVDFEIKNGRLAEPEDLPHIPPKKLADAQFKAHFTELTEDHHPSLWDDYESELDAKRQLEAVSGIEVAKT